jgi:hypothetical protein
MRKGLLGGLLAAILCVPALQSTPPTTPATSSAGQAAIADAARKGQYVFILFSREDDAATQAVRQTLRDALAKSDGQTASVEVHLSDPTEKALLDQYGISRAPMPLVLAVAPNGAVTGAIPLKLTEAQVGQAFVSPISAQCLKAVQSRKLVLLCVQPIPGSALPQGVRDFQTDPQYRQATEVVTAHAGDTKEANLFKRLQVPAQTAQPVTVLIAPPGSVLGTFAGEVSKTQLIEKLQSSKSCCPGGCCPGGCCGPNGCAPQQR